MTLPMGKGRKNEGMPAGKKTTGRNRVACPLYPQKYFTLFWQCPWGASVLVRSKIHEKIVTALAKRHVQEKKCSTFHFRIASVTAPHISQEGTQAGCCPYTFAFHAKCPLTTGHTQTFPSHVWKPGFLSWRFKQEIKLCTSLAGSESYISMHLV